MLETKFEARRSTSKPVSKFAFRKKAPRGDATVKPSAAPLRAAATVAPSGSVLQLGDQTGRYITTEALSGERSENSLDLSNLTSCLVNLIDMGSPLMALYAKNLNNCIVILPPIQGSAILHNLVDCTIAFSCQQVCRGRRCC